MALQAEGVRDLPGLFIYKGTNSIHEGFTLKTQSLPKGFTSKYSHSGGLGFNIRILGRHKHLLYRKPEKQQTFIVVILLLFCPWLLLFYPVAEILEYTLELYYK